MKKYELHLIKSIRRWLIFFMIALVISGITALDVPNGILWLNRFHYNTAIDQWLHTVGVAIANTNQHYPFLFYGYDWLAFAHVVIAVAFIGPYKDPVRNKWVIQFGRIACIMIIPFALIAGGIRSIPFWWQLIDCSFGILALWPLSKCYSLINKLESFEGASRANAGATGNRLVAKVR
jgi:hypothetical protein